jgi:hypothetical protein
MVRKIEPEISLCCQAITVKLMTHCDPEEGQSARSLLLPIGYIVGKARLSR